MIKMGIFNKINDQSSSDDEGFTKSTSRHNRRKQNKQQRATDTKDDLVQLVNDLQAEVDKQKQTISILTTRLNFFLSMFGVEESLCD